jgi:hypothetical protein
MGLHCKQFFFFQQQSGRGRVTILFKNSFEFKIHDEVKDTFGNYIILDIWIRDYRMTLAAVYGPNGDKPCFFENDKFWLHVLLQLLKCCFNIILLH